MDKIIPRLLPQIVLTAMGGHATSIRSDLIIGTTEQGLGTPNKGFTEVLFFHARTGMIEGIFVHETPRQIREAMWEAVERAK